MKGRAPRRCRRRACAADRPTRRPSSAPDTGAPVPPLVSQRCGTNLRAQTVGQIVRARACAPTPRPLTGESQRFCATLSKRQERMWAAGLGGAPGDISPNLTASCCREMNSLRLRGTVLSDSPSNEVPCRCTCGACRRSTSAAA